MDVARLNFSHGTADEHAETAQRVREAAERAPGARSRSSRTCPGPKLRIGALRDGIAELKPGDGVHLRLRRRQAGRRRAAHADLLGGPRPGASSRARSSTSPTARCACAVAVARRRRRVRRRGRGRRHRRLAPGPQHPRRARRACRRSPRRTSSTCAPASRSASTSSRCPSCAGPRTSPFVRKHTRLPLIAKIEKPQAVERAEEIVRAADCVMVARGDLGVELPHRGGAARPEAPDRRWPAPWRGPSITATQMLDSMVTSSRPTRAEVADVANAILDGTDAVMLSQETAVGHYPVEAIAMMAVDRRAHRARGALRAAGTSARAPRRARPRLHDRALRLRGRARAAASTRSSSRRCRALGAAGLRPPPERADLRALPGRETVRRCGLMWGVQAASMPRHEVTEELIADAARRVVELGWCKRGPARRHHRRAAERQAGHDEHVPGPGGLGPPSAAQVAAPDAFTPRAAGGARRTRPRPAQLGDRRVAVDPLARDPVPVARRAQLAEHGQREHLHAAAEDVVGRQRLVAHLRRSGASAGRSSRSCTWVAISGVSSTSSSRVYHHVASSELLRAIPSGVKRSGSRDEAGLGAGAR